MLNRLLERLLSFNSGQAYQAGSTIVTGKSCCSLAIVRWKGSPYDRMEATRLEPRHNEVMAEHVIRMLVK
jgi:hypothetical protein